MQPLSPRRVAGLAATALCLAGCVRGGAEVAPPSLDAAPSATQQSSATLFGPCQPAAVAERMSAFVNDITRHDGAKIALHFLVSPELRWEVNEHFDPPNGTAGALRSREQIKRFADDIREVWHVTDLAPPAGTAGLPDTAVYGVALRITSGSQEREGGAKLVVDCASGMISHMVGPNR